MDNGGVILKLLDNPAVKTATSTFWVIYLVGVAVYCLISSTDDYLTWGISTIGTWLLSIILYLIVDEIVDFSLRALKLSQCWIALWCCYALLFRCPLG